MRVIILMSQHLNSHTEVPPAVRALVHADAWSELLCRPMRSHIQRRLSERRDRKLLIRVDSGSGCWPAFLQAWDTTIAMPSGDDIGGPFHFCSSGGTACEQRSPPLSGLEWLGLSISYASPASLTLSEHGHVVLAGGACYAVTAHEVRRLRPGRFEFTIAPLGDEHRILVLDAMAFPDLVALYVADPIERLCLSLQADLTAQIPAERKAQLERTLQDMCDVGACLGGARYLAPANDDSVEGLLTELERMSLVQRSSDAIGTITWQISKVGLGSVEPMCILSEPVQAIAPRHGTPLDEMDYLELMVHLESNGWVGEVTHRSNAFLKKHMAPHTPESKNKRYYVRLKDPLKPFYLLALAQGRHQVFHGLTNKQYQALCLGKESRKRKANPFMMMGQGLEDTQKVMDKKQVGSKRGARGRGAAAGGRRGRARGLRALVAAHARRGSGRGRGCLAAASSEPHFASAQSSADSAPDEAGEIAEARPASVQPSAPKEPSGDESSDSDSGDSSKTSHCSSSAQADTDNGVSSPHGGSDASMLSSVTALESEPSSVPGEQDGFDLEFELGSLVERGLQSGGASVAADADASGLLVSSASDEGVAVAANVAAAAAPIADVPRPPRRVGGGGGGARTVDRYPRLVHTDGDGSRFHGIRCVRNPLLHGGAWDSMRAICMYHGDRCETSKSLTANPRNAAQGRCLGVLWAWLTLAPLFATKEEHCRSMRDRGSDVTSLETRRDGRQAAMRAINALPADADREYWSAAERPRHEFEPEEPERCP